MKELAAPKFTDSGVWTLSSKSGSIILGKVKAKNSVTLSLMFYMSLVNTGGPLFGNTMVRLN